MSKYSDDKKALKEIIEGLRYKLAPNVLDFKTEDPSTAFKDMGYNLIPFTIEGEQMTNSSLVGSRGWRLQVSYKAQTDKEYDLAWDKFETLYRNLHRVSKNIEDNDIERLEGTQFIYIGEMEFFYGSKVC